MMESHSRLSTSEIIAARQATDRLLSTTTWANVRLVRLQLALWVSLAIFCVVITFSPLKSGYTAGPRFQAPTDIDLYQAEIERIREGEGYYQAAAAELRSRGYPTASLFNWRTPLPMWLVAKLPGSGGQVLLASLAVAMVFAGFMWVSREAGLGAGALCAVLLFGAAMPCFLGQLYVMPVLWAGVLLGLSAAAYGWDRPLTGCVLGLAALFCRDLAGPYAVIGLVLAWRQGRKPEIWLWIAGLALYALFFAWHAGQVFALRAAGDIAHEQSWLRWGGAPFVISTVQLNAFLLVLPQWVAALYLVAALMGMTVWQSEAGQRVGYVLSLYVAIFAVVGHPFNQYWGAMLAPLLCYGAALFPRAARRFFSSEIGLANSARHAKDICSGSC